jgi:hypothetical protein
MRISIIPADGVVVIDGIGIGDIDMSPIDPSVHAVQWYGDSGEVEIKNMEMIERVSIIRNEIITDISQYQSVIDEWQIKRDQQLVAPDLLEIEQLTGDREV